MGNRNPYYFGYAGSKRRLMKKLVPMFGDCCTEFIEALGGSGYISINLASFKMPSIPRTVPYKPFNKVVYNEIDAEIYRLFNLLKSTATRDTLIDRLSNLESGNKNFKRCRAAYESGYANITDEIEKAAMTYTLAVQSHGNAMRGYDKRKGRFNSEKLRKRLESVADALEHIEIKNMDCFKLIRAKQNDPYCFIYCDPPYIGEDIYNDNDEKWSLSKHFEFAELCKNSKCKIMISNRMNGIYDEVFARRGEKILQSQNAWYKFYVGSLRKPQNKDGAEAIGSYVAGEGYIDQVEFLNDEYVYTNYYPAIDFTKYKDAVRYQMLSNRWAAGDEPMMIEGNEPMPIEVD